MLPSLQTGLEKWSSLLWLIHSTGHWQCWSWTRTQISCWLTWTFSALWGQDFKSSNFTDHVLPVPWAASIGWKPKTIGHLSGVMETKEQCRGGGRDRERMGFKYWKKGQNGWSLRHSPSPKCYHLNDKKYILPILSRLILSFCSLLFLSSFSASDSPNKAEKDKFKDFYGEKLGCWYWPFPQNCTKSQMVPIHLWIHHHRCPTICPWVQKP